MKNIKVYIIEALLFISIIVFNLIYKNEMFLNFSIILLTIISCLLFGFFKDNSYIKNNINRIVIACLLSFFVVTYSIGLFTGYNNTIFQFKTDYIFRIIILTFVTIICEELLRYIIAKKSISNKAPIIIYTVLLSLLNIIIEINGYNLSERETIFVFISVVVLTVISREVLCSYLTYNVSLIPCIIFKSIIVLYEFILPIIPKLGNYLFSVFNLLLVYCIFYFSNRIITYSDKKDKYTRKTIRKVIYVPILVLLMIIVVLVAGIFKYKMIAVASNSMFPIYEKGDAVIYEKVSADKLGIGDILAFQKENIIVTHRIVEIRKNTNYVFITKGDNNDSIDSFEVNASDVLGKVLYKIKYIGYPTVWLNEFFKGGKIS